MLDHEYEHFADGSTLYKGYVCILEFDTPQH
jgi:hypothetical protein